MQNKSGLNVTELREAEAVRLDKIEKALQGPYSFMAGWPINELLTIARRKVEYTPVAASDPRAAAVRDAEQAVLSAVEAWAGRPDENDEAERIEVLRKVMELRRVRQFVGKISIRRVG